MGAAWVLVLLNIGYVLVGIHFLHRRLLQLEKWRWYWHDVSRPILAALLAAVCFQQVQPMMIGNFLELLWLIFVALVVFGSSIYAAKELRASVIHYVSDRIRKK